MSKFFVSLILDNIFVVKMKPNDLNCKQLLGMSGADLEGVT